MKGFGQDNWAPIDTFDGFLKHNDPEMLKEIHDTIRSAGLSTQDYIVIDGDPLNAGFQVFVRWVAKETGCQLIWAKKLPATTLPQAEQKAAKGKMWTDVIKWAKELQPFKTQIYFVEISQERQDQEMLKIFGQGLLAAGPEQRPKYNEQINCFDHDGDLQKCIKAGRRLHPTFDAYTKEVEGYSKKGMEFCAFENAAKGLVIRSCLQPFAQSSLTLLTGGGQASVLEVAAYATLDGFDPGKDLAVFPASRGKPDTDPKMAKVVPKAM